MNLHERVTVLVAPNGGGKTAILDAVATALGSFVAAFGEGKDRPFYKEDAWLKMRPGSAMREMEPQWPVALFAMGCLNDNPNVKWDRALVRPKSHTTHKGARRLRLLGQGLEMNIQSAGQPVLLPVLAYYGTGRLWGARRLTSQGKKQSTSRTGGYADCLNPSTNYRAFEAWLARMHQITIDEKEKENARQEAKTRLEAVRGALEICLGLTGWSNLRYSHAAGGAIASHAVHGDLPVSSLSDGIRNMIALVGDIACRMVRLNPHEGVAAAQNTPGIVLIDEVDMHLHPEWQQVVVKSLCDAFPLVQFLITTHSPQVLTTVKSENIRILKVYDGQGTASQPLQNPYAREARVALEDIMDVPSRPPVDMAKQLVEYHQLIEHGEIDSERAGKLRRELGQHFGQASEEMQLADLVVARWKATRKAQGGNA